MKYVGISLRKDVQNIYAGKYTVLQSKIKDLTIWRYTCL